MTRTARTAAERRAARDARARAVFHSRYPSREARRSITPEDAYAEAAEWAYRAAVTAAWYRIDADRARGYLVGLRRGYRLARADAPLRSPDPDLSTSTEEVNQMTPRPVQAVTYNGGDGKENEFALIVKEHDGGATADLLVFDENGAGTRREAVPRRDPSDYGPEGGGHTWH